MAFERRGGAFLLRDTRLGNNALNAFNVIFPLFLPLKLHLLPPSQDDDANGVDDEVGEDDNDYDSEGDDNDDNDDEGDEAELVVYLESSWFK